MFSDQARLAFFPANADDALAYVNLVVWCILATELLFEVFIRPDGYADLIISDKAYAPTTVRFINAFHLVVESASLLCFIPEFYCLFTSAQCDERLDFSFFNAALLGVTGPTRVDFFYGKAYFALIRFRVFGLVRHWKKMWINNTFINMRWKAAHGFFSGSSKQVKAEKNKQGIVKKQNSEALSDDSKKRESVLTNASNIGTALMVTNSYRVLIMLCAIVGLFPVLASVYSKTTINRISTQMTEQLQATNLLVTDNSNTSCIFLTQSIVSWVSGLTPSESRALFSTNNNVYLLSLKMSPGHCDAWLDGGLRNHTAEGGGNVLSHICRHVAADALNDVMLLDDLDRETLAFIKKHCETWTWTGNLTDEEEIAEYSDIRPGAVSVVQSSTIYQPYTVYNTTTGTPMSLEEQEYRVTAVFNETYAIESS
jgi:hypothetical protein